MPSMSEIITDHTTLSENDHRRLKQVLSEWQLLADLAFSDLVLWVPDHDENVFWAVAQIRPTTGPTALLEDVVGDLIAYSPEHLVSEAFLSGEITQTSANKLSAGIPVDVHAIPVRFSDRVIGVVEQHTNQLGVRSPSILENSYLDSAADLALMVAAGEFPIATDLSDQTINPRVGDGFIRLDPDGNVEYASPNALSAYRRIGLIGDLVDENLASLTRDLLPHTDGPIDHSVDSLLEGRVARRAEAVAGDAHLLLRSVPLTRGRERHGAIVLCRDVSDLRSKERELITKDATIREIHHRVKNNLQTVAALLRMQARRIAAPEAKMALNDAMSRVAAIAIVHETLSQAFDEVVDFDKVADGLLRMVVDVAATRDGVRAVADRQLRRGVGRSGHEPVDGDHRAVPERGRARTDLRGRPGHPGRGADRARSPGRPAPGRDQRRRGRAAGRLRLARVAEPRAVHREHPGLGHGRRVPAGPESAGSGHSGRDRGPVEDEEALTDAPRSGGPMRAACRAQPRSECARVAALRRSECARVPRDA